MDIIPVVQEATKAPQEIPPSVAVNDKLPDESARESNKFLISFSKYKDDECEIGHLDQKCARKILLALRKIGDVCTIEDFKNIKVESEPIIPSGDYKRLWRKLPDDIMIYEHRLHDANRVFYYIDTKDKRIIHIIAIKVHHIDVGKNRN